MAWHLGLLGAAAGGGVAYRLQTVGGVNEDYGTAVATDSGDNVYTVGYTLNGVGGGLDCLMVKTDPSGTIQWQRTLGDGNTNLFNGVAVDSADNVYGFGYTNDGSGNEFLLVKYDSSGSLQWQRELGDGGSGNEAGNGLAIDSNDNIYVIGITNYGPTSGYGFLLAKYNSAGTLQWQRTLDAGSNAEQARAIAVDSSDNVYAMGYSASVGTGDEAFLLAKYDTSGNVQWQRYLQKSGGRNRGDAVATDAAGNIYIAGFTDAEGSGGRDFVIAKYSSAGSLQWQRLLGGSEADSANEVAVDSVGNIYIAGYTYFTSPGSIDFLFAKYDTSGTIQWQRTLGGTLDENAVGVTTDSLDNLYVFGYTDSTGAGNRDFLLAVLPNDGSLTGTYVLDGVNMVYAASSLTESAATLTSGTGTLTNAVASQTASTPSLTSASASLTEHRVDL